MHMVRADARVGGDHELAQLSGGNGHFQVTQKQPPILACLNPGVVLEILRIRLRAPSCSTEFLCQKVPQGSSLVQPRLA